MDSTVMVQNAQGKQEIEQKKGISGSTIKIIAIVAMLIDHIGATILERVLVNVGLVSIMGSNDTDRIMQFMSEYGGLLALYFIMRQLIGRIGFPIFCFLLVEGFAHTHDVRKYALRLGAFALISEIPFDLAFHGKAFYWGYQNVFFTLFLGLVVMIIYRAIEEKLKVNKYVKILLYVLALVAGAAVAELLKTDYSAIGVVCIMVLYIFRKKKWQQILAGCIAFLWEITAPLAFIPISFYNGKRGLQMKYFFYAFYPLHLLILYLIAYFFGLV